MRTENVMIPMRNGGRMGAYIAYPDGTPAGCIIAIMEIWGVNETMRNHAHEFARAGYICLVPDVFWRQEPGLELSEYTPGDLAHAFDLYYELDYDRCVEDMEDAGQFLKALPESNGKLGAVGYCLGGKLCYLLCCRTDIDCAVAYYGSYIEHSIKERHNLHRPLMLHFAMQDSFVYPEVNRMLLRKLSDIPLVTIHKYDEADHAFARIGGSHYRADDAQLAFQRSIEFFERHMATA